MTTTRSRLAKVCAGGLVFAGATAASMAPAWATYAPTTNPSTVTTVPPTHAQSAPAVPSGSGGLAFTGAEITGALALAAVAMAGGGTLVIAARRRKPVA